MQGTRRLAGRKSTNLGLPIKTAGRRSTPGSIVTIHRKECFARYVNNGGKAPPRGVGMTD